MKSLFEYGRYVSNIYSHNGKLLLRVKFLYISLYELLFISNKICLFKSFNCIFIMEAVAQRCYVKRGVLRNFAKFTGKHLCQSLFFNKDGGRPATLLKKRRWHRSFSVNFAKFLRTPLFAEHLWWLLLLSEKKIFFMYSPS